MSGLEVIDHRNIRMPPIVCLDGMIFGRFVQID
jgi:hypothetical protein